MTVYVSYIVQNTEIHLPRGRWGRSFEGVGGRLLQVLSLRRGANSKRGAYLKLGANSSIYGIINSTSIAFVLYN